MDYVARVIDELDVADSPRPDDYGFSTFVSIPTGNEGESAVGIVYNSMLMNPEYANYGPRLSSMPELGSFSPDFINEQGCLIGILLLGAIKSDGEKSQGIPKQVISPGVEVFGLSEEEIRNFHIDNQGSLQIHYYSQVISHAGNFAAPLLESIIERISTSSGENDKKRLEVLRQNLKWQRTIGATRL